MKINDQSRGLNGPLTIANNQLAFKNKLAVAIDAKDDLNVYDAFEKTLKEIGKSRFVIIKQGDTNEREKLFDALLLLLKSKFAEHYYIGNIAMFNNNINFNNITTIYQLINAAQGNTFFDSTNNITDNANAENYLFKILAEALEDYPKLRALARLNDWFANTCQFNTAVNPQYANIALINLCDKALADESDCASLVNNLNCLLDDPNQNKQTAFINYLKTIMGIDDQTLTTVNQLITHFHNQAQANTINIPAYKNLLGAIVHTLGSDEAFNLAIVPNAVPKYRA